MENLLTIIICLTTILIGVFIHYWIIKRNKRPLGWKEILGWTINIVITMGYGGLIVHPMMASYLEILSRTEAGGERSFAIVIGILLGTFFSVLPPIVIGCVTATMVIIAYIITLMIDLTAKVRTKLGINHTDQDDKHR